MFAVRDLLKDLELASHVFDDQGGATPLTHETLKLYSGAMNESADLDISAIARVFQHSN
jgi:3-hydroxyisobutyrate dehydrogenase-like beta-hydroxyacid dehydrogenase